jgi:tetratricopeptide (TPR) repeat protein
MKVWRDHMSFWLISVVMMGLLISLQFALKPSQESERKLEQLMYLPDGEYMKIASLGYRQLLADLLWIRAIQVMGDKQVSESNGRWLYRALDIVTTLDPQFVRAYEAGGLALTTLVVLPEESNRLMKKGMQHNPTEWKLPFLVGINYYYELYDDAKAADYISQASRLPNAPSSLATLAANLYVSAHSPQQAVNLLSAMYQEATDESARKLLEIRLKIVITERDLSLLEQAIDRYRKLKGINPPRLDALVTAGLLSILPVEPAGGRYVYDAKTGAVSSSEMPERLTMSGRRRNR